MRRTLSGLALLLTLALVMTSCAGSGGTTKTISGTTTTGTVYVTGSDAPLPSVLAFQMTINKITLFDSSKNASVDLTSEAQTVEFSRLLGLRTLLALNAVPEGTYTSVTIQFSSPVISYLDLTTTPASVSTINGTLLSNTVTHTLAQPLTVTANGLGGLHMHFNLRDSIQVDTAGEMTGIVNPKVYFRALQVGDDDATIDELRGGLVSVNTASNLFVLQRRFGRNVTVVTDANTNWDGTDTINTLSVPAIIEVSGTVRADGSILATDVQVITRDHAFVGGIVLNATPTSGAAESITLLVREEIPDLSGIDIGKTGTLEITPNTMFDIYRMRMPVQAYLFNSSMLVRGQRVSVGGTIDSTTTPPSLATRRVILHRQGFEGTYVTNSLAVTNGNTGSFQLQLNGMHGYLFGAPLKVITSNTTRFRNLSGLQEVATTTSPVYAVGLLLKDPNTGDPVLVAGVVGVANSN